VPRQAAKILALKQGIYALVSPLLASDDRV